MLDSQNSKYTNDKIIYYLLILIWLINLFSINTGFYSVKNFYNNFNINYETFVNFVNTLRWFGPILVLPILNEEKGNVVAAIQCINKENDGVFDENDVEFLEEFCKQISVSVGNALAYDATQQTMEKSSENRPLILQGKE